MTIEPRASIIATRLQNVNRVIAVASGKGGVGKSLIATGLATILTQQGHKVGLLDLDLYGPSDHIILGIKKQFPTEDKGLIPPTINNLQFMSIVYFTEDKPAAFRGTDITNIIIELLAITQWGHLDYLIIDMPPGIGDETLDIIKYIPQSEFIIVTTPSKVAYAAVQKLIDIVTELKLPLLGVIENMNMHTTSFTKKQLKNTSTMFLGSIPFDMDVESAIGNTQKFQNTKFIKDLKTCINTLNL